ncbi:hypothetical protein ACFVT2_20675 [Streptomyces sp. NPDC058000]|uniref:hypothetical protein n=1 Tax=Streptomyces sp. NPDC058000 TaxID=3346299 RepID=UPI0036EA6DA4
MLLGLGIAWRPTVKPALAASIAWSLGVWWFGEGVGGVLTGTASPVSGAPGAVILYALLAVLLWPTRSEAEPRERSWFVAERPVGMTTARLLWLVLWGSLAYFAVQAGNRSGERLHDTISQTASGQPGWLVFCESSPNFRLSWSLGWLVLPWRVEQLGFGLGEDAAGRQAFQPGAGVFGVLGLGAAAECPADLLGAESFSGLPWHLAALRRTDGGWTLMPRAKAAELGRLIECDGRPSHQGWQD